MRRQPGGRRELSGLTWMFLFGLLAVVAVAALQVRADRTAGEAEAEVLGVHYERAPVYGPGVPPAELDYTGGLQRASLCPTTTAPADDDALAC